MSGLMTGKRGLIMGLANDKSLAWGIAKQLREHGAELAFSYQGDALKKRVGPLAEQLGSDFLIECDVSDMAALDTAFDGLGDWLAAQRAHGRDIVLILPRPTNTRLTPELLYQYTFDAGQPVLQRPVLLSTYNAQMGYARALLMREARRSDAKLVDPTKFRCGVAGCPAYEYGKFLFRDRHHIRASLIGSPRFAFIDAAIL